MKHRNPPVIYAECFIRPIGVILNSQRIIQHRHNSNLILSRYPRRVYKCSEGEAMLKTL
jgi:hypothetical protein